MRADGLFVKVADRDAEPFACRFGQSLRAGELGRVEIDVRVKRMCGSHRINLGTIAHSARGSGLAGNDEIAALEALYRTYLEAGNSGDLET